MMQHIHDKAKGLFANIIVGLIIITFVLWGVQGYVASRAMKQSVASVNDDEISLKDFQKRYQSMLIKISKAYGEAALGNPEIKTRLKQTLLQQMIQDKLLNQASESLGLKMTDQQLKQVIERMPDFQENGDFSQDRFEQFLKQNEHQSEQFLTDLEQDLMRYQLQSVFSLGAFALEKEVEKTVALLKEQREMAYLTLTPKKFTVPNPSEQAMQDNYEANKSEFTEPETVKIAYLELKADALKSEVMVSEEAMQEYYQDNLHDYHHPKRWHVAQIVADKNSAKATLEKIQTALNKGQDFSTLAKQYSIDLITRDKGGDLGWLTAEMMSNDMRLAMTHIKKTNQISDPYLDEHGYVFLKLLAIKAAEKIPYEQVKKNIKRELASQQLQKRFTTLAEDLSQLTFSNPETLEVAANQLNLEVHQSNFFNKMQGSDAISHYDLVRRAAFSEDVRAGNNSDMLQLGTDKVVVLRVLDHKPSSYRSYVAVREKIKKRLIDLAKDRAANALADQLLSDLKSSKKIDKLLNAYELTWKYRSELKRDESKLDPQLVKKAFESPKLDTQKIIGSDGVIYIMQVKAIKPGRVQNLSEKERISYKKELSEMQGTLAYQLYENYLREKAKITVNLAVLNRVH